MSIAIFKIYSKVLIYSTSLIFSTFLYMKTSLKYAIMAAIFSAALFVGCSDNGGEDYSGKTIVCF